MNTLEPKTTAIEPKARLDQSLQLWLTAERDDRTESAESALQAVFASLPAPLPSAEFAQRVLVRTGLRPMPYPWWSRATIAACLLLVGLAAAFALPLVFSLFQLAAPSEIAAGLVQAFVALINRVDEVLAIWQVGARIAATLALVATAPQVIATLLALTACSVFTFRGVNQLLSPPRSSGYA
ncbi:MAG: hypothetical protein AAF560_26140 [Acidobacteriota bacterium]